MRIAALLFALFPITVGVVGLVSPDSVMTVRREYIAVVPYAIGAVRIAMGLVLLLFAPASRTPKTLRALGAVICVQGLVQGVVSPFVGLDRARAILEWEAMHTALLRAGAMVALAIGAFIVFAATDGRSQSGRQIKDH